MEKHNSLSIPHPPSPTKMGEGKKYEHIMSKTTRRNLLIFSIIILIAAIFFLFHYRRANSDFTAALAGTPQNAFFYLNPANKNQLLISAQQQQKFSEIYLNRYFTPWSKNFLAYPLFFKKPPISLDDVKQYEIHFAEQFQEHPGYGINRLKNSSEWIDSIMANMNMGTFPNRQQKAITLLPANLRVLPTNDFSFAKWDEAGEGYPFDYLQESSVPANLPILILQTSQDGAWDLVLTNNDIGWIESQNVASVDEKFIQEWQTGNYVTPLCDNIPIKDNGQQFRFMTAIGAIFPLTINQTEDHNDKILIAVADDNDHAIIKTVNMDNTYFARWPLPVTSSNFASMINNMLGVYYGWGGINGYRDCSLTTMNLFSAFGIWLPRNAIDQSLVYNAISLQKFSAAKKLQFIKTHAIPFLTLFHLPGHIVLYIGEKNGQSYIFHEFWGVHTKNLFGEEGRAIVGKSAITPITLGQGYINVPKRFIDSIDGMTLLEISQN